MKRLVGAGFVAFACLLGFIASASAQGGNPGCSSESSFGNTQILHCQSGITIIAEEGARFSLQKDSNSRVEAIELDGKALLIEVAPKSGGNKLRVITPQAIAAVRGTRWAVDVVGNKTSVFVINGRVGVGRQTGSHSVTLGPGEGIDVEPGAPLTVKRWAQPRVSALLARLGQ